VRPAYAATLIVMCSLAWIAPRANAQLVPPPLLLPPPVGSSLVTMTSPASGSAVTGIVPVSASASNAGSLVVAGVRLRLDGVDLGVEQTRAPYSVSWDTTTAINGFHTLSAVARDAAGVEYASELISVRVSNGPTPPSAGPSVTRFEETDPSLSYTAGWSQSHSDSRPWSGGTAAFSETAGAQATFTFTGSSISWIGFRGPQMGIARVFLDGAFVTELDTMSNSEEVRVPVFTATGLADASHTLTIEVTGRKHPSSSSSVVVVDAFEVPARTVSRLQETDPAIIYTAGWIQSDPRKAWSGGTAAESVTPGGRATFSFAGTSISWIGARGPLTGIARVFLDGVFVAEVDTYAPVDQIQAVLFAATDLADASHTLAIEVTGRKNQASTSALVIVDGFDVISSGTRYQETHASVAYGAGWVHGIWDRAYSERTIAESGTPGARATFTFTGSAIAWVGGRGPITGIARVFLDDVFVAEVDTYSPMFAPQKTILTLPVSAGTHTLAIEVTGRKNPASTEAVIVVDAFDVKP
jgi:trimeric autotransporter adhesin